MQAKAALGRRVGWVAMGFVSMLACSPQEEAHRDDAADATEGPEPIDLVQQGGPGGAALSLAPLPPPAPHTLPPPVFPYNFATQQAYDMTDRDVEDIAAVGFGGTRFVMDPFNPNLARHDVIVRRMWALGQTPVIILMSDVNNPPRDPGAWQAFANASLAVAQHFVQLDPNGRIVWEIWNEPNGKNFWRTGPNAAQYAGMAVTTARALRAVPHAVVAPGVGSVDPKTDLPFLEAIFRAQPDLANNIDAVSVHGYEPTGRAAPETRISRYAAVAAFTHKPIMMSEWGWATSGGAAVTPTVQAVYAARLPLINMANGIQMTVLYTWRDSDATGDETKGIRDNNYRPKPSYAAVQGVMAALMGFAFDHKVKTGSDYVLVFRRGDGAQRVAYWTTGAGTHNIKVGKKTLTKANAMPRVIDIAPGSM